MKKQFFLAFIILGMMVSVLPAAQKKTADDWKKEIESQIGPVTWVKADGLKKAKEFKGKEAYYVNQLNNAARQKVIITSPEKRSVEHTQAFDDSTITNILATKPFSELNKNDVFITFGNRSSGYSYVWMMESQKTCKNALKKNPNGSYSTTGDYSSMVMKYDGWTQNNAQSTKDKTAIMGKTQWYYNPRASYSTIYNTDSQVFSILITNYEELSLSEIKLVLLGKSDKVPFIQKAVNDYEAEKAEADRKAKEMAFIKAVSLEKDNIDISSDSAENLKVKIDGQKLNLLFTKASFQMEYNKRAIQYYKVLNKITFHIADKKGDSLGELYTFTQNDLTNDNQILMELPAPEQAGEYSVVISFLASRVMRVPFTVKGNSEITASDIPNVLEVSDAGKIITARLFGRGFSADKKFTVSCDKFSEINEKAEISVIDSYTANISFPVPKAAGKYQIKVSCDSSEYSKSFNVLKSDKITFGRWPQTIAKSGIEYTETNKTFDGNPVFKGNDGNEYVKVSAKPFENYSYSDGTEIEKGKDYYFKIEPIEWKILDVDEGGNYTVCASKILTSNIPYCSVNGIRNGKDKNAIYPNNYKYSNIRAYLNGIQNPYSVDGNDSADNSIDWSNKGFLNSAFTEEEQNKIKTTEVDNGVVSTTDVSELVITASVKKTWDFKGFAVSSGKDFITENTNDKIFLLSENEVTSGYFSSDVLRQPLGFDINSDRQMQPTDYALANHCWMSTKQNGCSQLGYGWWWLRSPKAYLSDRVRAVQAAGDPLFYFHTDYDVLGIVPAMKISVGK